MLDRSKSSYNAVLLRNKSLPVPCGIFDFQGGILHDFGEKIVRFTSIFHLITV